MASRAKRSSAVAFNHRSLLVAQERILVEPDRDMVQHFATEALAAELLRELESFIEGYNGFYRSLQ